MAFSKAFSSSLLHTTEEHEVAMFEYGKHNAKTAASVNGVGCSFKLREMSRMVHRIRGKEENECRIRMGSNALMVEDHK